MPVLLYLTEKHFVIFRFQFPKLGANLGGHLNFFRGGNQTRGGGRTEERSRASRSSGSDRVSSSSLEGGGGSAIGTPGRAPGTGCEKDHDDLYNWMVRQQEYTHAAEATRPTVTFPQVKTGQLYIHFINVWKK